MLNKKISIKSKEIIMPKDNVKYYIKRYLNS